MVMRVKIKIPKLERVMSAAYKPARAERNIRRAIASQHSARASTDSPSGTRAAAASSSGVCAPNASAPRIARAIDQ